jgi:hypothetical protein
MIKSMATTETEADLRDIAGYTQQITHLTKKRALIGEKRKAAAKRHHFEEHVPIAALARAMGISPTAAYRLVHGDGSKNAPRAQRIS